MASSSLLALPPPSLPPRQVLIKQEIQRKSGYAIQVDEEHLRVQLDTIQSELNAPTQFKVGACVGRVFFFCLRCQIIEMDSPRLKLST